MYDRDHPRRRHRAVTIILVAVTLPVLFGMASLTIDVGHMYGVRANLQHTADAAALAGVLQLPSVSEARNVATEMARANYPSHGNVLADRDIHPGNWNPATGAFTSGGEPINAVRVVTRRSQENGNPVSFFFAGVFGLHETDISAAATAYFGTPSGSAPVGVRFVVDDEMFDTDIPVIADLANDMGVSPDVLLTDADGDDFVDFPPGVIELPTGQVGDEALFEILADFPYTNTSTPSLLDFLLFEEGGDQRGILKSELDPLMGANPIFDPDRYPEFINPNYVHVSPLYKSDVSNTDPGVNALGERRGLIAFKILAVGQDPDGAGSYLPNLVIEIVDPSTIGPLSDALLGLGILGRVVGGLSETVASACKIVVN